MKRGGRRRRQGGGREREERRKGDEVEERNEKEREKGARTERRGDRRCSEERRGGGEAVLTSVSLACHALYALFPYRMGCSAGGISSTSPLTAARKATSPDTACTQTNKQTLL